MSFTAQEISQALAGNQSLPFANFSNIDTGADAKYLPYPLYDGSRDPKQSWMESGSQWGSQWAAPYTIEGSSYGYLEPGQVIPTYNGGNIGGNPSTWGPPMRPGENGGGVQHMRPGENGGGVQHMRPGENGGGVQHMRPGENGGGVQHMRPGENGGGVQHMRPGENGGGVRHYAPAPAPILRPGENGGGIQNAESQYESAVRAFELTHSGNCGVSQAMFESEKQALYAGHRLFGNLRLAQGNGDLGEVLLNGKATIVNPAKLNTVVQGLSGQEYDTPDAYRDDSAMTPFAKIGGSAGGLRPELYVGTISEGLSMPVKMETVAQRSFLPNDMPTTFNIFPESEAAAARKDNVARLNRIQRNYIQSRLNAASSLEW
jgi:hypothetical protein